jgi:DNA-binding beta-propeller fold protein YncE
MSDTAGGSHAIYVFDARSRSCLRVVGTPGAGPLQFQGPRQLWIADDAHVFVADFGNNRIQELDPYLAFYGFIGVGSLEAPVGVCANDEVVVVAESSPVHRISVFTRGDGVLLRRFGGRGSGDGQLYHPHGLCFMSGGTHVAVADRKNNRVCVFSMGGKFVRHVGVGDLSYPGGVACDWSEDTLRNQLVVADTGGRCIRLFSEHGKLKRTLARDHGAFTGVVLTRVPGLDHRQDLIVAVDGDTGSLLAFA